MVLPPHAHLLFPTRSSRDRSVLPLGDRIALALRCGQEQSLLLDIWPEAKQVHNLGQSRAGFAGPARRHRLVGQGTGHVGFINPVAIELDQFVLDYR